MEAEYTWLFQRQLKKDCTHSCSQIPSQILWYLIYRDNHLRLINSYHPGTKHIDVCQNIEGKKIVFKYKNTLEMVADTYTEPLPKPKFEELRGLMGVSKI